MSEEDTEMNLEETLAALREEASGVEWTDIVGRKDGKILSQKVMFWDKRDWRWVANPYKDNGKQVDPKERYPDLSDAGIARQVAFNS